MTPFALTAAPHAAPVGLMNITMAHCALAKNVGILLPHQNEFCGNVSVTALTNFEILSQ
jgi:hypothetical protein